jgi:hypothetical protein
MVRHAVVIALALVGVTLAHANDLNPLDLIGQGPKPFVEAEGFYRVVFPGGFDCAAEPRRVECIGNRGHKARIWVVVEDVPTSATPELMLLNEMQRYQKKSHFKDLGREKLTVRGLPAVAATFSYDYMGNVEHPVGVKVLYVVQHTKLYIVHFECRLSEFMKYRDDLGEVYRTFWPTKLDEGGNPVLKDLEPAKDRGMSPEVKNPTPFGW